MIDKSLGHLPKGTTRHIPRKRLPIGAVKDGKVKIFDGEKQKASWRGGKKGLLRDLDGTPTSTNRTASQMRRSPSHKTKTRTVFRKPKQKSSEE